MAMPQRILTADRCRRLNSPIIQLFLEPFSRPLIFLDDAAAVSNIVCTRTKELDHAPISDHRQDIPSLLSQVQYSQANHFRVAGSTAAMER
ncbi:hypothetical protein E4U40_001262 [Claviceps sp. LM458 group G5]|nr:hypothetical protein E4U40_001262 [Claviceps sp. LM458 group G5]